MFTKLVWVLVIVITGLIGAIIYLAVGRPAPPGNRGGALPPPADQPAAAPPGALNVARVV
ncbi:MAG TPA: PLDc N-terminal domain-containing protein [Actinomycetota bacterium]|nr:PLDc N-terminal domain-containing protein [Actinomycetota bacterium]